MKALSLLMTSINIASYPPEFQQLIIEKSQNCTGRELIFSKIVNFINSYSRGYLTIVGAPGSGKSAILSKYVMANFGIIYYNAQIEYKNLTEEFLKYIYTQFFNYPKIDYTDINTFPNSSTEGSRLLSLLLQKISNILQPEEHLIIAIDGLEAIDRSSQPPGTNLLYLPRYLPDGIYFILARRPFKKEKSGLLIEAPSQILDLSSYGDENWDDIPAYTQHWQKIQGNGLSNIELEILYALASADNEGISSEAIAENINADICDVEEALDNWFEFLKLHQVDKKSFYSFYHRNFSDWLLKII